MLEAIMQIPSLLQTQADILNKIRSLQSDQQAIDQKVADLATNVERAESCASSVQPLKNAVEKISTRLQITISSLAALHDSQSRRNSLIIYGLTDAANVTLAGSEERVASFLFEKLNTSVTPTYIERAHRLGQYAAGRMRPLIVKFLSFKNKQRVLAAAPQLKGTNSVSPKITKKL